MKLEIAEHDLQVGLCDRHEHLDRCPSPGLTQIGHLGDVRIHTAKLTIDFWADQGFFFLFRVFAVTPDAEDDHDVFVADSGAAQFLQHKRQQRRSWARAGDVADDNRDALAWRRQLT